MKDILLQDLLEAGCHFGHKAERWHPKAEEFIYQKREGIHVIDLAKTKSALLKAAKLAMELGRHGKNFLLVATKRQAKGVVTQAAKIAELPYLTTRWIGGFITNWEEVSKNIKKLNTMRAEKEEGKWQKFPKHEQVKLDKELRKLELVYGGVANLEDLPEAVFMVDIKREDTCLHEVQRKKLTTIAIVDTNADPYEVDYPIPANDDAVGSIQYITNYLVAAFLEGKKIADKEEKKEKEGKAEKVEEALEKEEVEKVEKKKVDRKEKKEKKEKKEEEKEEKIEGNKKARKTEEKKPKKRGRPKKSDK